MKIEWSEKLSVSYGLIDDQHKELIDRINALLTAMAKGQGRDKLNEVIEFVGSYVDTHFGTEEGLMRKYNYPAYESHKKEHEILVAEFLSKKTILEKGNPTSSDVIKTYNWLADWLANHIMQTDMKLGPFLKYQKETSVQKSGA
jgi:hemerythrin